MKIKNIISTLAFTLLVIHTMAAVYWVSPTGTDAATGLTRSAAWQTLDKVSDEMQNGDIIRFKRASTWNDTLFITASNISFVAWGEGREPVIQYVYIDTTIHTVSFQSITVTNFIYPVPPEPEPDVTPPVMIAFSIPDTSNTLSVSIDTLTATDDTGVTAYNITETSTVGSTGWVFPVPTTFVFDSDGDKTLYAWAKDAAGNVSDYLSAEVVIILPDTIAPEVTAFVILTDTSSSFTVDIDTFTATDNVAVTGYKITDTDVAPLHNSIGWTETPLVNYTFNTEGTKVLYGWAKDEAGNVSTSLNDTVEIAIPDTTDYPEDYSGTIYYVSADGDDGNAGTKLLPFETITKVNTLVLNGGDAVLFNSIDTFSGKIIVDADSVTFAAYGVDTIMPVIDQILLDTTIYEEVTLSNLNVFTRLYGSYEYLLIHSAFDGTTYLEHSTDVDSIAYFYPKGESANLTQSNWISDKDTPPVSRWHIMTGSDTFATANSPVITTDPLDSLNDVLQFRAYEANEYYSTRPASTRAARTQFDMSTSTGYGFDSIWYRTKIMFPSDWEEIKSLQQEVTWMTIAEFFNESSLPNFFRISITAGKYSTGAGELNFNITTQTYDGSTWTDLYDETDTGFDIPLDEWFEIEVNIIEGGADSGKIYMAAKREGIAKDTIVNATTYTKHPDLIADGYEYFAPLKLYTYAKYADSVRLAGKDLRLYYDDFELIEGRNIWESPIPPPPPPDPIYAYGDILQESFEGTGYENSWTEVVGSNTGVLVDEDNTESTITGGGSQILKTVSAIVPTATSTASRAYTTFTAPVKQAIYADFWVYLDSHSITASSAQAVAILQDSTSAANTCITLSAYNNAGTLKFFVTTFNNNALANFTSSVTWELDTWYHAQLKYDITNMTYAVNINGSEITSGALTGTVRANVKRLRFGANATTTYTAFYDLVNLDSGEFSNY